LKERNGNSVVDSSSGDRHLVLEDRQLVDSCLSGDTGSWRRLYLEFHGPLLASIQAYLGAGRFDQSLVDEIAARVWYVLVQRDFKLLSRFDIRRGCRLTTFLSMLAKTQTRILLRSEKRRRMRERWACRPEGRLPHEGIPYEGNLSEQEFVSSLSSSERAFYRDVLVMPAASGSAAPYQPPEISQLRHRIKKKLKRFLGHDDSAS
jgi:hypothetical protein